MPVLGWLVLTQQKIGSYTGNLRHKTDMFGGLADPYSVVGL